MTLHCYEKDGAGSPSVRIPVLLDTDIGSDIDDAIALAYLLRQPRCEVVGITTVTGAVEQRSACAAAVCDSLGRPDIPIVTGLREPLASGPGQPRVPHYAAVERYARDFPDGAVEFLRSTIRERPGDLVLLSIGPFTNIATLFALDPDVPGMLRGYVSMGGKFPAADVVDWNAMVDPLATAIVYHHAPNDHVSVGIDVTMGLRIEAAKAREVFEPISGLWDMVRIWLETHDVITLHDPLAAATVFRPELCRYADGEVSVSLDAAKPGATSFMKSESGRHRITTSVDAVKAEAEILGVIRAQGSV